MDKNIDQNFENNYYIVAYNFWMCLKCNLILICFNAFTHFLASVGTLFTPFPLQPICFRLLTSLCSTS